MRNCSSKDNNSGRELGENRSCIDDDHVGNAGSFEFKDSQSITWNQICLLFSSLRNDQVYCPCVPHRHSAMRQRTASCWGFACAFDLAKASQAQLDRLHDGDCSFPTLQHFLIKVHSSTMACGPPSLLSTTLSIPGPPPIASQPSSTH